MTEAPPAPRSPQTQRLAVPDFWAAAHLSFFWGCISSRLSPRDAAQRLRLFLEADPLPHLGSSPTPLGSVRCPLSVIWLFPKAMEGRNRPPGSQPPKPSTVPWPRAASR